MLITFISSLCVNKTLQLEIVETGQEQQEVVCGMNVISFYS